MPDAIIIDAVRTSVGRHGGASGRPRLFSPHAEGEPIDMRAVLKASY